MARILLTGFEPFGENQNNISEDILNAFGDLIEVCDPWQTMRDSSSDQAKITVVVDKKLLTVDRSGSISTAKQIMDGESWDAIIHMGLCESCNLVRFETRAQNLLDMRIPDNAGRMEANTIIGEEHLHCSKGMVTAVSYPPISSVVISNDAGSYLCNETYFRTLEAIKNGQQSPQIPCCFVHFPSAEHLSIRESVEILQQIIARLLFKPVIDVAAALWLNDDKIMLAKRNNKSDLPGCWEFPGGKVEPDETIFNAISRELQEEFNIAVEPIKIYDNHYHEYQNIAINLTLVEVKGNVELLYLQRDSWTSHDNVAWFADIEHLNIAEADRKLALEIINHINAK